MWQIQPLLAHQIDAVFTTQFDEDVAPFLQFDAEKRIIEYDGDIELARLVDGFYPLIIQVEDDGGDITQYLQILLVSELVIATDGDEYVSHEDVWQLKQGVLGGEDESSKEAILEQIKMEEAEAIASQA